ncbi:helix-turn-helix domain-containing protein [Amorphus coralli]|uniref:helix-turn-helix domain-containing protein n=1 Tax=Amorphus coralli TaxID=340680 RepID=UPI0012EC38F3|nr:winged helix DNA-binding protein [Amorphus coralli]
MAASRKLVENASAEAGANGGWHLARTPDEERLAGLEFALERVAQAYYRWKAACFSQVAELGISGDDVAILNMVRYEDRPKRLSEIGQLLNRTDVPNMQYAMRKFVKAELVEAIGSGSRRDTRYQVTDAGREVTDAYAELRRDVLLPLAGDLDQGDAAFSTIARALDALALAYGSAAQSAPIKGR